MNPKALLPLVVGLGIAGVAAKMGMDYLKKANASQVETVSLWMVEEDVLRGEAITESMLKKLDYPKKFVPPGAIADPNMIVGRVPHTGVNSYVPILESMLCAPGALPGIVVPEGYRAVAVKINESSGVDNHLVPGCRVDVVGMFEVRNQNQRETVARTILENIQVAAVGQRLAPANPEADEDGKKERPARAVTLLAKPDQVPILHLAEQKGKLKLSMRSNFEQREDFARSEKPMTEGDLLGGEKEEEQEKSLADSFRGWMDGLIKPPAEEPEPAPVEVVVAPPAPPEPPPGPAEPKWVMKIWNGDSRQTLAWTEMDSIEPQEVSADGPSIFEDEPARPPIRPPTSVGPVTPTQIGKGGTTPTKSVTGATDPPSAEPTGTESEPEPKELFE